MLRAIRLEALLLGAVLAAVPLYRSFVEQTAPVADGLAWYVLACVFCTVGLSIISSIYYSYAAKIPRRRRSDLLDVVECLPLESEPEQPVVEPLGPERRHLLE